MISKPLFPLSVLPLIGLVPILASCQVSPKVWVEDSKEFTIPAQGIQSVDVKTYNGAIKSQGVSGLTKATVLAKIRAGGQDEADAKACLAAVTLQVEAKDGVLQAGYDFSSKRGWQVQVSFEIQQPHKAPLTASTHNGGIHAKGIQGRIEVDTHNGGISVQDCEGEWALQTHNGGIHASGKCSKFALETHNGGIAVHSNLGGPITGNLTTHNGGVQLTLSKRASATLECSTTNGRVKSSLPLTEQKTTKTSLRGKLGEGQTKLRIRTHNGAIDLEASDA